MVINSQVKWSVWQAIFLRRSDHGAAAKQVPHNA